MTRIVPFYTPIPKFPKFDQKIKNRSATAPDDLHLVFFLEEGWFPRLPAVLGLWGGEGVRMDADGTKGEGLTGLLPRQSTYHERQLECHQLFWLTFRTTGVTPERTNQRQHRNKR